MPIPNSLTIILFSISQLFLLLCLSPTIFAYSLNEIKSWCNQTPNPQPCEFFLSQEKNDLYKKPIKQKSDFFKLSTLLALDRAKKAQNNIFTLDAKCRNSNEKAAWLDCLELYEYTIQKLNKTIIDTKCTQYDTQTWLSTALTNLDTCRAGLQELGVSEYLLPLMSNNVTRLISNTLALNKVPYSYNTHPTPSSNYKYGFPNWVKPGDRKLLQSTSQANVVVAQDGSGNYKTISEAINGRKGSGRFVIYVKAGTYEENIEIKVSNIMLIGDGIGKTIITGSKSVGGGTTTFKSATVGKLIIINFLIFALYINIY